MAPDAHGGYTASRATTGTSRLATELRDSAFCECPVALAGSLRGTGRNGCSDFVEGLLCDQAGVFEDFHVVHDGQAGLAGQAPDEVVLGARANFGDGGEDLAVGGPEQADEELVELEPLGLRQLAVPALLLGGGLVGELHAGDGCVF